MLPGLAEHYAPRLLIRLRTRRCSQEHGVMESALVLWGLPEYADPEGLSRSMPRGQ